MQLLPPITIKYNGKPIVIDCLQDGATIGDLKTVIFEMTNVLPETQKILGLRTQNNEPIEDSLPLSTLIIKPNSKFMLIGSTREAILDVAKVSESSADIVDDFDLKEEHVNLGYMPENIEKVKRRSKAYRPRKLCEPRPGKRLLVLDIDYTIFDNSSAAESALLLARPFLYDFLKRVYEYYDIAIWSATSMTWILAKLTQLGIVPPNARSILRAQSESANTQATPPACDSEQSETTSRICLLLDSSDMITVLFPVHGVKEVKPLAVIWDNHPQWGPHNTVMLDDIRRNFVMNPQSGLRIRAYKDAYVNQKKDRELLRLAKYLELIATNEQDFTKLNHNKWDRYLDRHKRATKRRAPVGDSQQLQATDCLDTPSSPIAQDNQLGYSTDDHIVQVDADPLNAAFELSDSEDVPDPKLS